MKRRILLIALILSLCVSAYFYVDILSTVKRWQYKAISNGYTLLWTTKNPHFIAIKLWFELTYNICAVSIFGYSAIQLLRRKR